VVSIGGYAFSGCTGLTSINIPVGVESIGGSAFRRCTGLTGIDVPAGVTSIGDYTFYLCQKLTDIVLPAGLTSIGEQAFYYCTDLASVAIPGSVESIGASAFDHCSKLKSVTIPEGVESIGEQAFAGCTSLASVTIPGSVESIGEQAFAGCGGLTSVTIPGSVESIGYRAFYHCTSLKSVTILAGVTSIGNEAFYNCSGLKSVTIPGSVASIGSYAFFYCTGLASVTIPEGVTSIGGSVFEGCTGLASVTIADGVESIGDSAFGGCKGLTSIHIPAGVESIGSAAFRGCTALAEITVDTGNPFFMSDAGVLFDKAQTTLLAYPGGGGGALHVYKIQSKLTSKGNYAFFGCSGLASVAIPEGVASIGNYAFCDCTGLKSVTIPEGVESIGDSAFRRCTGLASIAISDGVTSIGDMVFGGCSGLASVTIPGSVTSIGEQAFSGCSGLASVTISEGVASIGNQAFAECLRLTSIVLPDSVTSIGSTAFYGSGIGEIHVPASVTDFGAGASPFANMPELNTIIFSHGRTDIPDYALYETDTYAFSKPVNVYVPLSVRSVDPDAFSSPATNITVCGVAGSYIEQWAVDNGVAFEGIDAAITKYDYDEAYRLVPYQYIIETDTDRENLSFEVVGGGLPAGLELLQTGQFHGAPLETGGFTFHVAIYFALFSGDGEKEYLMDLQEIILHVEEPDDDMLEENNLYPIDVYIGESQNPSGKGDYVLAGPWNLVDDRVFRIEDIDPDGPGGPEEAENNFPFFTDFWVDGRRLTSGSAIYGADYGASEGSTVVTVYAKTFQSLDNGPHTIAAEFMIPDPAGGPSVSKVAAQKFTLELTVESPPAPPVSGPSGGRPSAAAPAAVPDAAPAAAPPAAQAAAWQNPFGDVDAGAWYYADVAYVCENGLMNGTSATGFDPNAPMTRGMLVTVLHRAAGSPAPPTDSGAAFTDLPAGAYYAEAAAWAAASGILTGAGDGRAAPLADISRQDLAALLARYAAIADKMPPAVRPAAGFADEAGVADYAREAVRSLAAAGVLNGRPGNIFDPQGNATRAEAAAVLHRFLEAAE
jgi:hypothetical protein